MTLSWDFHGSPNTIPRSTGSEALTTINALLPKPSDSQDWRKRTEPTAQKLIADQYLKEILDDNNQYIKKILRNNKKRAQEVSTRSTADKYIQEILETSEPKAEQSTSRIVEIEEEEDEDLQKNQTRNPLDPQSPVIISFIETATFEENDDPTTIIAALRAQTTEPEQEIWINAKTNVSMELAMEEASHKEKKTLDEMIPPELSDFKDVFDKKTAERFPESRPWDHTIDLKEDFVPKDCKVYPLTVPENEEMNKKFIDENLAKGYIQLSK